MKVIKSWTEHPIVDRGIYLVDSWIPTKYECMDKNGYVVTLMAAEECAVSTILLMALRKYGHEYVEVISEEPIYWKDVGRDSYQRVRKEARENLKLVKLSDFHRILDAIPDGSPIGFHNNESSGRMELPKVTRDEGTDEELVTKVGHSSIKDDDSDVDDGLDTDLE